MRDYEAFSWRSSNGDRASQNWARGFQSVCPAVQSNDIMVKQIKHGPSSEGPAHLIGPSCFFDSSDHESGESKIEREARVKSRLDQKSKHR